MLNDVGSNHYDKCALDWSNASNARMIALAFCSHRHNETGHRP